MLTLIESLSLAGDRTKQNDDAHGSVGHWAWVIDGATDLYAPPHTPHASDAAWIAHALNAQLAAHAAASADGQGLIRMCAGVLAGEFSRWADPPEGWRRPAASLVLMRELADGIAAFDLGDSRLFALDADGKSFAIGGPDGAASKEARQARAIISEDASGPPLSRQDVLEALRPRHMTRNRPGGWWVFAPDPACADHVRTHHLQLARPAHVLLATDGFAALADRYGALTPEGLVAGAVNEGLAALAVKLRAIEGEDAGGARHPRFKKSDDATALLLRLD
jgi:hypothetical protein